MTYVKDELGFVAILTRDLRLASRRRVDILLPLAFFVVAVSLFPFGVGPEPNTLRQIAAGVVWVSALLATMLSVSHLYAADHADGSLEQMLLAPRSAYAIAAAKASAHWCLTGAPLVLCAPVLGTLLDMNLESLLTLTISLLLGTPILSLLGGLGAALTLGLRSGSVLLILLILPLCIPTLIFGAGAVSATDAGLPVNGHFSLMGALLLMTGLAVPWGTAAALRIAVE